MLELSSGIDLDRVIIGDGILTAATAYDSSIPSRFLL